MKTNTFTRGTLITCRWAACFLSSIMVFFLVILWGFWPVLSGNYHPQPGDGVAILGIFPAGIVAAFTWGAIRSFPFWNQL